MFCQNLMAAYIYDLFIQQCILQDTDDSNKDEKLGLIKIRIPGSSDFIYLGRILLLQSPRKANHDISDFFCSYFLRTSMAKDDSQVMVLPSSVTQSLTRNRINSR